MKNEADVERMVAALRRVVKELRPNKDHPIVRETLVSLGGSICALEWLRGCDEGMLEGLIREFADDDATAEHDTIVRYEVNEGML